MVNLVNFLRNPNEWETMKVNCEPYELLYTNYFAPLHNENSVFMIHLALGTTF